MEREREENGGRWGGDGETDNVNLPHGGAAFRPGGVPTAVASSANLEKFSFFLFVFFFLPVKSGAANRGRVSF